MKGYVKGLGKNKSEALQILNALKTAGFRDSDITITCQKTVAAETFNWGGQIRHSIDPDRLSLQEISHYEYEVKNGKILISVKVKDKDEHDRAMMIFEYDGAKEIKER